jgi:hypothetical protein
LPFFFPAALGWGSQFGYPFAWGLDDPTGKVVEVEEKYHKEVKQVKNVKKETKNAKKSNGRRYNPFRFGLGPVDDEVMDGME